MQPNAYKRVDLKQLSRRQVADADSTGDRAQAYGVRWFIIPLSIILCLCQAWLTISTSNPPPGHNQIRITSTLISVMGFAVLMLLVLAINPLLRLVRLIRPLGRSELMTLFAAMLVTAGIASFGMTEQLIPLIGSPWNPDWNTPQVGWDKNLLPNLNPKLYLTVANDADEDAKQSARQVINNLPRARPQKTWGKLGTGSDTNSSGDAGTGNAEVPAPIFSQAQTGESSVDTLLHVLNGTLIEEDRFQLAMAQIRSSASDDQVRQALDVVQTCFKHNTDVHVIRKFREGVSVSKPLRSDGPNKWSKYYRDVFQKVPWSSWGRPLAYWLTFVFACYAAFYFLTYVVLGSWTDRDKLIFPLARLPEALIPDSDQSPRWFPATITTTGFWAGFLISFLILSYNAVAAVEWLPGMKAMRLGLNTDYVNAITKDGILEGLSGGQYDLKFAIMFTAIGIAFLLPTQVSFSIWFYFCIGKLIILLATWMGYGRTGADFPTMWLWKTNVVTSLGAGGLLCFSAISLLRCVSEYAHLTKAKSLGQRLQLLMPLLGLLVCLTILVGWLCWSWWPNAVTAKDKITTFIWAWIFVWFLTLLTLGLMRVVAESGMYWIQNFGGSFFHLYKALGLGVLLKPMFIAPLLPIYSVLFLDLKTFIAPNIMNAAKLQRDTNRDRIKFHVNLVLCIVATVMFSSLFSVYMAHERGANQMDSWFYTNAPKDILLPATVKAATDTPEFDPIGTTWYATGAGWVVLTMWLRKSLFWFPHPIGFIMMNNPLTSALWFSFFLGWVAKALVVKYGAKMTFDRARLIFIGLIMGELSAVFFWPIFSILTGFEIGVITLNRYGP